MNHISYLKYIFSPIENLPSSILDTSDRYSKNTFRSSPPFSTPTDINGESILTLSLSIEEEFIEIPAGKLDKGEMPLDCANRELAEEIGYVANNLTFLTKIYPAIGFSNEVMWMYLGEDLVKTKRQLDSDEFLELAPFSVEEAFRMVKSGKIMDVKTVIGIMWYHEFINGIK